MGKAAVDLPDPLENPQDVGATANADDLLSQLADNEIQRLLEEAEVQRAEAPAAPDPPPPPPMELSEPAASEPVAAQTPVVESAPASGQTLEQIDEATAKQLDSLFQELQAAEAAAPVEVAERPIPTDPPAAEPAADTASDDPEVARQLDDLFSQLTADEKPKEPAAESPPAPIADSPRANEDDLEEQVSAQVLAASKMLAEPLPAEAHAEPAPEAKPRFTWLVRTLELLNGPLNQMPESFREALGKVAIITLINAMAILIYVLFFR